ncbi:MAG: MmgE/PrpD family protein [Rhizobiales bacterium]|nr:MmgE/PrpD family protein [Hyphomicrobiales bacterium]
MGLTAEIGTFLADMQRCALPPEALAPVRAGFTDCVAVMVAGRDEPVSRIVAASVGAKVCSDRVLLDLVDAPAAALVYGTAAHAIDYDDTGLSGHPSAVLVPAILAESVESGGASGQTMARAYIAGYEVWAELIGRDKDQHHLKGWHPTAVFGTVAAASASAVIRGLDADRAATAAGISASLAGGIVANFGTMTKPFQVGRAAQSGLQATRLAEAGFTASHDAFEHDLGFLRAISPNRAVDTENPAAFGREWRILQHGVNIKLYPICYGAHRIVDAMIDVVQRDALRADGIAGVNVEMGEASAAILRNHRPQSALDAKFSAEFAMAAAAIAGRCGMRELTNEFVLRRDVQAFMPKVAVTPLTERSVDEPLHSPFDRVRITLRDNRAVASEPVYYPRGHFKNPVDAEALWGKFADCIDGAPIDARRLFDVLQEVDHLASVADIDTQGARS